MGLWRDIKSKFDAQAKKAIEHLYFGWLLAIATLLGGCNPFVHANPELCALVDTHRAIVFSDGHPDLLRLSVGDIVVKNDVSTATIVIWNQGNTPIRNSSKQSNMLDPFVIQTLGNVPILDASVMKQTRGIIGFQLLKDQMGQGKLSATWNTLEKEDGVVLQVIYAGPPMTKFSVTGTPELQARGVIQYLKASYLDSMLSRFVYKVPVISYFILLTGGFASLWTIYFCVKSIRESQGVARWLFILAIPAVLIVVLGYALTVYLMNIPNMPYGI